MDLNRHNHPRLAAYLDGLPQHILSYPEVMTRADYSLILRPKLASVLQGWDLPVSVKDFLNAPWKPGEWIPTVAYVALCEMARDHLWRTEEEFHQGMFDVGVEMYHSPMLRAISVVLGPSIVALGATKRWSTLHKGTTLTMKKQQKECVNLTLGYPPKIFSEAGMKSLGAAICAAVSVYRGKNTACDIIFLHDTEAELFIKWEYW